MTFSALRRFLLVVASPVLLSALSVGCAGTAEAGDDDQVPVADRGVATNSLLDCSPCSAAPDLQIPAASVALASVEVFPDTFRLRLSFDVVNTASVPTSARATITQRVVTFSVGNLGAKTYEAHPILVGGIGAGEKRTIVLDLGPLVHGAYADSDYVLSLRTDESNTVDETNENNNTRAFEFRVSGGPSGPYVKPLVAF